MTQKPYKCRLEYLEGTGTQYIDIGFVLKDTHSAEVRVRNGASTNACGIFGSRSSATSNNFAMQIGSATDLLCDFNNSNWTPYRYSITVAQNTAYTLFISKEKRTINGTGNTTICNDTITTPANGYLFGVSGNPVSTTKFIGRIYYCKIWDNGTLVRDFIPVLDNSGRPAMYDQVSGQLFYNQGAGEFTYGRQIIPVEYLESSGTQRIDTGVSTAEGICTEVKFKLNSITSTSQVVFGKVGSTTPPTSRYWFGAQGSSLKWYYAVNEYITTSANSDADIHTVVLDTVNNVCTLDGETIATFSDLNSNSETISLFSVFYQGSLNNPMSGRIYYTKIWNNNTLVRDFIPCIDENNTPFMFDKVNNKVYLNAGTGQFKAGPNVEKVDGKKLLRKKLALMLANLKKKRKYYTELEYLESSGTQYIDLGVTSKSSMRAKAKFNLANVSAKAIFGSANAISNGVGVFFGTASTGAVYCNNTSNTISPSLTLVANTNYEFDMSLTTVSINGVNYTASTTTDNNYNMLLFARTLAGNVDRNISGKIYYFKLYDNGVLIRDVIPVLDWDMTPCMYDKVTEQLFYNQGTGDFIAGRQIHPVEYLESTGEQYIDTGIIPNINTECSMNLAFVSLDSTYRTPFSVRTADGAANSFTIMSSRATNDNNSFAFGSNYWSGPSVPSVVLNKTVEAVLRKGYASWNGVSGNPGTSITPTTLTAYMFARNANGTAANFFIGKIYSCLIKDNNTTVRDYIPAIDENGVGFMFDRVSHTIYDNAGTGAFSYPAREVEYLQSSGTQYIDTGVKGKNNLAYKTKINYTSLSTSGSNGIGGEYITNGSAYIGMVRANGHFTYLYYNTAVETAKTLYANTDYVIDSIQNSGSQIVKIDDEVISNGTLTGTFTSTRNVFLFAICSTNDAADVFGSLKMYYLQIHDGGVLVRDFVPVFKDGVACMVDKLTGTAYLNQGTGSFSVGRIVEPEYE